MSKYWSDGWLFGEGEVRVVGGRGGGVPSAFKK